MFVKVSHFKLNRAYTLDALFSVGNATYAFHVNTRNTYLANERVLL